MYTTIDFDPRFKHPERTWASATHRAFSFACVGAAMANETWKFVQAKSKQAMKQVLQIRDEKTRMKVTPPLAVAPITQEDDMRWNPKQRSFSKRMMTALFPTLKGAARPITTYHHIKHAPATSHIPQESKN